MRQPKLSLHPEKLAPSDFGGYWTFVVAMILVLFVFYTASNGLLSRWLGLFVYSKPTVVTNATTAQTTAAASQNVASGLANSVGAGALTDGPISGNVVQGVAGIAASASGQGQFGFPMIGKIMSIFGGK